MYILLVKVDKNKDSLSCRIVRSEKLRYSWKDHEKRGFRLLSKYDEYYESLAALRRVKSENKVSPCDLNTIWGCWL